jgi:hypothetical protein
VICGEPALHYNPPGRFCDKTKQELQFYDLTFLSVFFHSEIRNIIIVGLECSMLKM